MNKLDIKKFLNKRVSIGIPHSFRDGYFHYFGVINSVNNSTTFLTLDSGENLILENSEILKIKDFTSSGGKCLYKK